MPIDPCLVPTTSILLDTVGNPRGLKADLNVAPVNGNPLEVVADVGVETFDPYASDQGGIGVNDGGAFLVRPQVPPTLGVRVTSNPVASGTGLARLPQIRLPGAGNGRLASMEWPGDLLTDVLIQLAVADPTNPRIDRIVATWNSLGALTFQAKTGTPTSGATLDNLSGAGAIDATTEVRLADVLVDAGAVTIGSTKIRDRRRFQTDTGIYLPASNASVAPVEPVGISEDSVQLVATTFDNHQSAALVKLTRPITANYLYWRYTQIIDSKAVAGTWVFAIMDASKRLLLQTGVQSFATPGGAGVVNRVRVPFTSQGTVLPAGYYYVLFGVSALNSTPTSGAQILMQGYGFTNAVAGPIAPNVFYNRSIGSINPPTALDGVLNDSYTSVSTVTADVLPVPVVAIGEA